MIHRSRGIADTREIYGVRHATIQNVKQDFEDTTRNKDPIMDIWLRRLDRD